jgi:alkanesulfonate monooxygenase SsuD/methylene tetrahydromethanopterin reductase-like flavin-dependent oxidoreductase (luciferase family)
VVFRGAIAGAGVVRADIGGRAGDAMLAVQPQSPGLAERIWWGSGSRETAVWAGEQGMNLMSSTLLLEDTQVPFDELQAQAEYATLDAVLARRRTAAVASSPSSGTAPPSARARGCHCLSSSLGPRSPRP